MNFGDALELLKSCKKVARKGWNGRNMYVFIDNGYNCVGYESYTGKKENFINAHFLIKNVDDSLSTWVPSVNDCLANDWVEV